jgi:hypothetical protein
MSGIRRIIVFMFFVLTVIDLYNCILSRQEFNQIIRPLQMLLIIAWMFTKVRISTQFFIITLGIAAATLGDYFEKLFLFRYSLFKCKEHT